MPRNPNPETQCQQVFPTGRRCRLPRAKGHPSLCAHHAQQTRQVQDAETLAAQLLGQIEDFTSAAPVNQFLANLLRIHLPKTSPLPSSGTCPVPTEAKSRLTTLKRRAIEQGTNACARRGPPQTQVTERKSLRWPGSDNLEAAGGGAYDLGTGPQDRECILYSQ